MCFTRRKNEEEATKHCVRQNTADQCSGLGKHKKQVAGLHTSLEIGTAAPGASWLRFPPSYLQHSYPLRDA